MKFSTFLFCLLLIFSTPLLYAQTLQDDFSDGNFTTNPTWIGDAADFIVNGTNQLQTDNNGNSATSQLSTAALIQDSTTWEFYVQMDFAPSTSNYTLVYLQADDATPANTTNGYYMRLGNTGSTDALELYRVDGGSATQIWSGTAGAVASNPTVSVRVVRDNAGVWSIFADYAGGTAYVLEGTVTDATHNAGTHFGLFARYTSTRGDQFFFDNIFVSPLFVDVTPPIIDSIAPINSTTVDVYFDEVVDATTANDAANYALDNGATVTAANLDATDLTLVHLTTSPLTSPATYQLTVNGVTDLNNNPTVNEQGTFTFINIQAAAALDIIINEIFADPTPQVGLPSEEYIELYNISNKYIQLGDLTINDGANKQLPNFILAPDSIVIIASNSNVATFSSFGTTLGVSSLSLSNGGELLTLADGSGNVIDSVNYTTAWYQDAVKDDGGWSLELINPGLLCIGSLNWIASIDATGGTPGQINSVYNNTPDTQGPSVVSADFVDSVTITLTFDEAIDATAAANAANYVVSNGAVVSNANFVAPFTVILTLSANMIDQTNYTVTANNITDCSGNASTTTNTGTFQYFFIEIAGIDELIITEIMADPTPQVGLPPVEYIELYNNSNKTLDLANYTLDEGTIRQLPTQLMQPNTYVVLVPVANAASFASVGTVVPVSGLSLSNSGELLSIFDPNGTRIHFVEYSSDWYQDAVKDDGGWSLEMININLLCKEGQNWTASLAAFGGTPAQPNSVNNNTPDNQAPKVNQIYQYSANQIYIGYDDIMNVNSITDVTNYSINNGSSIVNVFGLTSNSVILNLAANMVSGTTYTIGFNNVNNIEDCVGNILATNTRDLTYYEADTADIYDVIINEIMADPNPVVGLPEKEYVELYNRSNKIINLQDYQFTDGSSVTALLPSFILQPGAYVLVYSNSDTISFASFGDVLAVPNFPDLNTSDELILISNTAEIIDAVGYDLSWYQNADKDDGGWSLERANPDRICESRENWRASENLLGGTPCAVNSILETSVDDQAPDVIRAFPLAPDSIQLFFSEGLDLDNVFDISNYSIDNGISVVRSYGIVPFFNSVILILDQPITAGTTYTVTMGAGFTDCLGNPIALNNSTRFALPETINEGDLILNEILPNPVTSGNDFIELYNNSNKVLNASDLVISNALIIDGNLANTNSLQTDPILTDWLIFPGEYVVISEGVEQVLEQYETPNPNNFISNNLPTFADKEGSVFVYVAYDSAYVDALGNPQTAYLARKIDLFDYTEDIHTPLIDDKNGVSLERIDFDAPTNDPNNWHSASTDVGYATPAYQNSSFMVNDIMSDDLIVLPNDRLSPDGDGYEDFLLINYNVDDIGFVANIDIYDASGRLVRNLINGELLMREGTFQWDGTDNQGRKPKVGIYILKIVIFNANGDRKEFKKTCVLAGRM